MRNQKEKVNIVDLITDAHLVISKSQVRRLVVQGEVKLDDAVILDMDHVVRPGHKTLSVGTHTVTFRSTGEEDDDDASFTG